MVSKQTGVAWLVPAWMLLGAVLLLVSGSSDPSRAAVQVEKIEVNPVDLTVSEPSGTDVFTVTLSSEPTANVYIDFATSSLECSVAPVTLELDATNWASGVIVTVSAVDDLIADGTQICRILSGKSRSDDTNFNNLNVRDVKVTVYDNDVPDIVVLPTDLTISEPSGSDVFTVTLTSAPAYTVSIPLSTTNNQCTVMPASVDLDVANWVSGVRVTVTAVDDSLKDGPQTCLVQTRPANTIDTTYAGLDPDDVTVTVNDVPGIVVTPTSLSVSEPSGTDVFTLTLTSKPTATVFVPLAAANNQCMVVPTTVELDTANWASGSTVTVSAVDDPIKDGTQACLIETGPANSTDSNYLGQDPEDVTVTVYDDDAPQIIIMPTNLTISEPSGSAVFTMTLTNEPTATVSVPLSASNNECTVVPTVADLDASNWASGVAATVTAVDDDLRDGDQICLVKSDAATSNDPLFDGLGADDVRVTVKDDDTLFWVYLPSIARNWPPIPGIPTLDPVHNGDGDGTYTLGWSIAPRAALYILEESTDHAFSGAWVVYAGTSTSYEVTQRGAARYYYRVKAHNSWGDSGWSTVQQVDVLWEAEPNDQAETQANGPIVSGPTYYGTLPSTTDRQDYFYFDLSTAHGVRLSLTNIPAGQDYNLILRNAGLNIVGYSAELENVPEYIEIDSLPAGRYYIQVYLNSSGQGSQAYHLRFVYK